MYYYICMAIIYTRLISHLYVANYSQANWRKQSTDLFVAPLTAWYITLWLVDDVFILVKNAKNNAFIYHLKPKWKKAWTAEATPSMENPLPCARLAWSNRCSSRKNMTCSRFSCGRILKMKNEKCLTNQGYYVIWHYNFQVVYWLQHYGIHQ